MNIMDKADHSNKDKRIKEDIKKLVIARVRAMSDELGIVIGSTNYSKKEILDSIEKEDEIGKEMVEIQMDYLRDMAEGAIYHTA